MPKPELTKVLINLKKGNQKSKFWIYALNVEKGNPVTITAAANRSWSGSIKSVKGNVALVWVSANQTLIKSDDSNEKSEKEIDDAGELITVEITITNTEGVSSDPFSGEMAVDDGDENP